MEAINSKIEELQEKFKQAILVKNQEIEDLKTEVNDLRTELEETKENLSDPHEVTALKTEVKELRTKLEKNEERLADSDALVRRNNIIISGNEVPNEQAGEDCAEIVRNLVQSKLRTILPSADINTAFRIGKKGIDGTQPQRSAFLVKLKNTEVKTSLIAACKTYKPGFFINDDLSPQKQTIMYVLRQAKQQHPNIISGTASPDGRICAWIKPQTPEDGQRNRKVYINSLEKLRNFCANTIKTNLQTYITRWPQ